MHVQFVTIQESGQHEHERRRIRGDGSGDGSAEEPLRGQPAIGYRPQGLPQLIGREDLEHARRDADAAAVDLAGGRRSKHSHGFRCASPMAQLQDAPGDSHAGRLRRVLGNEDCLF